MIRSYTLTMLAATAGLALGCQSTPASQAIHRYGFTELRPPSTLTPPGTYITSSGEPARVGTICTAETAFGNNLTLNRSSTQETQGLEQSKKNVSLGASYMKAVAGDAKYASIKDITYSVKNATVLEVPDASFFELAGKLKPECARAITFRLKTGEKVSVVKQVLEADIEYNFTYNRDAGLSVEDKVGLVKGVAAKLGVGIEAVDSERAVGKSLYWGIRDEQAMVCELAPRACQEAGIDPGSRGGNGEQALKGSILGNTGYAELMTSE